MKRITHQQIKDMYPCYKPEEIGITYRYDASVVEFINEYRDKVTRKPDIIWVLCRNEFMDDKNLRLFAVWNARQVRHLIPDDGKDKFDEVLSVVERYANGLATDEELTSARSSAWAFAGSSARAYALALAQDSALALAQDSALNTQIDKLLAYFIAEENNIDFVW